MQPATLTRARRRFTMLAVLASVLRGPLHALPGGPPGDSAATKTFSIERPIPEAYRAGVGGWITRLGPYYTNLRREKAHYLAFIENLLSSQGLPRELAMIPVVESHFNADAVSVAGACGVWQIMPAVAQEANLALSPFDDRRDVYKSSHVGISIVRRLFQRFGDPLFVVAAYNCGEGRMTSALSTAGSSGPGAYWAVHSALPAETQAHVLKYLAAVSVFYDKPLSRPATAPAAQTARVRKKGPHVTTSVSASFRQAAILRHVPMSAEAFEALNPQFDATLQRTGTYVLTLPESAMIHFLARKRDILQLSMSSAASAASAP